MPLSCGRSSTTAKREKEGVRTGGDATGFTSDSANSTTLDELTMQETQLHCVLGNAR
jgi:hypothetical protein